MPADEQFDRVDAISKMSEDPIFSDSFMGFVALTKGIANRFIARRRRHLWGLIPDDRYQSSVEDIHIGSDKPWRLRVWPIPGQDGLYVDNTKHLVERTASGAFCRVGYTNFTPERRSQIIESISTALKFEMI